MNRKVGVRVICVIIAVALGGVIWAISRRPTYPSQQLPDGSIVTIKGVTYGRTIRLPEDKLWKQVAAGILPAALNKRLGVRPVQLTNATDAIFIVVETYRTNGTFSAFPREMATSFSTRLKLSDDIGNTFERVHPYTTLRGTNSLIEVFIAPLISRVPTQLKLELEQNDFSAGWGNSTTRTLSFAVPNPAPPRVSKWQPSHLPMTNQIDNLTIVLSSVPAFTSGDLENPYGWPAPKSYPGLSIFEDGKASTNWSVVGLRVLDEAGNSSGGPGRFSPVEPRKFRFTFNRNTPTSSDDVVVFRNVPVPVRAAGVPHVLLSPPLTNNYQNAVITIDHLTRGSIVYGIKPRPANQSHRLIIEHVDRDGFRQIALTHFGSSGLSGANIAFGNSSLSTKPTEFADLKFVFTTNVMVEFIAFPGATVTNPSPEK